MERDPLASAPRRVEAYLDQILAPLTRRLSPFHRDELRRELREHLWARVDAYRELGMAEGEAVTEALRQFGGAEDFLSQWRREWTRAPRRLTLQDVYEATMPALRLSMPTLMLAYTPILVLLSLAPLDNHWLPWLRAWLEGHPTQLASALVWSEIAALPIGLGLAVGWRTPNRPGLGVFAALTAEAALGAALNGAGLRWWPRIGVVNDVLGQIAVMEAAWIPVACTTASLTGWWARRSQARRLA